MAESSTDVADAAELHSAPSRGRTWTGNRWLLYLAFVAYLATQAKMLNDGARLYHDTVDRKPPVVPYLYAAVFRVTGSDDIRPVRVLMILTNAMTALLLAVEAQRRFRHRRAGVIAGLLFLGSVVAFQAKDGQVANFEVFMLPTIVASVMLARRDRPLASGFALAVSTLMREFINRWSTDSVVDVASEHAT